MNFKVLIPARYASTRFPGKVLADLGGKPMLQHVYERAVASGAETVVIATDDDRICKAAESFGAHVCMTSLDHASGTDRIAEAVVALGYPEDDIIVNLQGDEPLIPPILIKQVAENLERFSNARVATLSEPLLTAQDLFDTHKVKVVTNKRNYALYFSRAPIAWPRGELHLAQPTPENTTLSALHLRHVGIYAFRVAFLQEYSEWASCLLEQTEQLEQLRVLWNGGKIHVAPALAPVPGDVNTPQDLELARKLLPTYALK